MLLAVAVFSVHTMTINATPIGALLPTTNTKAIIHNPDVADAWWIQLVGTGAIEGTNFDALAWVEYQGVLEPVVISRQTPVVPDTWIHYTRAPYKVAVPSETMATWLTSDIDRIDNYHPYQQLRQYYNPADHWLYLDSSLVSQPEDGMARLLQTTVTNQVSHLAISNMDTRHVIRLVGWFDRSSHAIMPEYVQPLPTAMFTITTGDINALWEAQYQLELAEQMMIQARLQTWLKSLTGNDVSLQYDMMPLLRGQTTLAIAKAASGIQIAIRGSTSDHDLRDSVLNRMHQSFNSTLDDTVVTSQQLDDTFSARYIRVDLTVQSKITTSVGQWLVTTTGNDTSQLSTAVNGSDFVITNDAAAIALDNLEATGTSLPLPEGLRDAHVLLGGMFTSEITIRNGLLHLLPDSAQSAQWSLSQSGDMRILIVENR